MLCASVSPSEKWGGRVAACLHNGAVIRMGHRCSAGSPGATGVPRQDGFPSSPPSSLTVSLSTELEASVMSLVLWFPLQGPPRGPQAFDEGCRNVGLHGSRGARTEPLLTLSLAGVQGCGGDKEVLTAVLYLRPHCRSRAALALHVQPGFCSPFTFFPVG